MKLIPFNNTGGRLKVSFTFKGTIAASYTFILWESGSNTEVMEEKGTNLNPDDDSYNLPLPTANNDGRIIDFGTTFKNLGPGASTNYTIKTEVFQDGKLLGDDSDSGIISNEIKRSKIYIKLVG